MKQEDNAMPKSIINENEREAIGNRMRRELRKAQEAYVILKTGKDQHGDYVVSHNFRGLEDLGEIPTPDKVTEAWLDSVVERKRKAIKESDILATYEKNSRIGHLYTTEKKARPIVQTIEKFIKSIPAANYRYDDQLNNFYVVNFQQIIDGQATREVPPEATEHWRLIQEARAAVDKLREFEKQNLRVKKPLDVILRSSAGTVAEEWATNANRRLIEYEDCPALYEVRTSTYL